jgi:hypothetical protein
MAAGSVLSVSAPSDASTDELKDSRDCGPLQLPRRTLLFQFPCDSTFLDNVISPFGTLSTKSALIVTIPSVHQFRFQPQIADDLPIDPHLSI